MYIVKEAVLLATGEIIDGTVLLYQKFDTENAVFGFLDECGNFHDRISAMEVARDAKQIVSAERELYAEDLWREPQLMED